MEGGHVIEARLVSRRPAEASRILEGKPLSTALTTVPLLWSICSVGHTAAALGAVEAALGARLAEPQRRARELLTLAEGADNHAWQLCLEWPRLAGLAPDAASLQGLRAATARLKTALFGKTNWRAPGGVVLRPERGAALEITAELEARVGALLPWPRTPSSLGALRALAVQGASPGARVLALAFSDSNTLTAGAPLRPLPALGPEWFLARRDEPALSMAPLYQGMPAETGALARQSANPVVAEALREQGAGTLARLIARLVDLEALPQAMQALAAGLGPAEPSAVELGGSGAGACVVETSRGLLAHVVTLESGQVVRWRTVAPTEWNFHPEGPLSGALRGLPAADLPRRAALAAAALDPCVGCQVRIVEE